MSDHSAIEWTDATWNPVRGCTKISPGCAHCYAETMAERFRGVPGHAYEQGFDLRTVPEKLAEPLRWTTPRMIFVNSMSDLFHEGVPDDYILRVAEVMRLANWHTYQVLTKRSERLRDLLQSKLAPVSTLPHIWWGVSVENPKHGLPRVEHLRAAPAALRFLSIEPLLAPLGRIDLTGIHWVIVGGESGPGARPMQEPWVVSIRDQCREAGTPFFFKQWGGCRKGKAGRELGGVTHDEMPPRVHNPTLPSGERRKLIAGLEAVEHRRMTMGDTLPTIWPASPHTLAKHAILRRYLKAWLPILSKCGAARGREILYIDGFAGPGEYTNGEEGSPLIALKAALYHEAPFPIPVRMLFIEKDQDRFEHLKKVLAPHLAIAGTSRNIRAVEPQPGDCDSVLNALLADCKRQNISFGPALAFLDQFGYGAVSMDLIRRIMEFGQCEVFSYLDYKDMNRWITDETKAPAFTRAYEGEEWRGATDLPERERRRFLLDKYMAALKDPNRGGAAHVTSFAMFDRSGQLLYWLIFCTNHLRGLEEMKRAMWDVDDSGEFRFSDQDDPSQSNLFSKCCDQDWLADELARQFAGQVRSAYEVKEFVLTETPCHQFRTALKKLEAEKRTRIAKAPTGRRRGAYPEDQLEEIEVVFERSLFSI